MFRSSSERTSTPTPALSQEARHGLRLLLPKATIHDLEIFELGKPLVPHPFGQPAMIGADSKLVMMGNPFHYGEATDQMTRFLQIMLHQSHGMLRIIEMRKHPSITGRKYYCFEAAIPSGAYLCVVDNDTSAGMSVDSLYFTRLENMFAAVAAVLGIEVIRFPFTGGQNSDIAALRAYYEQARGLRSGGAVRPYGESTTSASG